MVVSPCLSSVWLPGTFRTRPCGALFAALLQEFGDQARPAGLMAGAQAGAVVAMKVFVEEGQVAPVRTGRVPFLIAVDGTTAFRVAQEGARQAAREFRRDFPEV